MRTTSSRDGTLLAYDRSGSGPPLIFVGGAFSDRSSGAGMAALLGDRFAVVSYDRRGRGGSEDTPPYAVAREIEDLAAIIETAGEPAAVFGISSGAVLALHAAAAGLPITRLAAFEPPFIVDDARPAPCEEFAATLSVLARAGHPGDAAEHFLVNAVQVPPPVVTQLREAPVWAVLESAEHTLSYDARVMGDCCIPAAVLAVDVPTLVLDGELSPDWARDAVRAVAALVPRAEHVSLPGQTHDVDWEVLAPVVGAFLAAT